MRRKKLLKYLTSKGFIFIRHGSAHDLYGKGAVLIPVPRHKEINEELAQAIIRKCEKL